MTLISIHATQDRAEILTDTAWWRSNLGHIGYTTKVSVLAHLDAVIVSAGSTEIGYFARYFGMCAASDALTFDELVDNAPQWLLAARDNADDSARHATAWAFLVGYSHRSESFTAYVCESRDDFTPKPLREPFVTPTPWSMRPSSLEARHARRQWEAQGVAPTEIDDTLRWWLNQPHLDTPTTDAEWADLARRVQAERTLGGPASAIVVAGDALLTRLERGTVTTRKIGDLSLDVNSEAFRQSMAYTDHPVIQLAACVCGSSKIRLNCCLNEAKDKACACGSGKTFRACCMVQGGLE